MVTTGAGDVNVIGSDLRSGKDGTVIDSARDVNVTAYYDQRSDTRRDELHRQGIATDVNADGVHIGLREKGQIEETTVSSREARTSSLSSDGGVSISAGRTLTNEGTKIRAAGDIVLEAEDIINKAAHNEYATTTARTDYDLRQQAGLSANGSGQSISDAVDGRSKQVNIGTPEAQLRVKVDVTQSTDTTAQSNAVVTDLRAGGNIVVKARNTASDEGSRYDAQQNVVIDAAAYESRAAANTSASAHGDTQTSSTATGGVNLSAQATFNANSSGSSTQSSSTRSKAVVGNIKGGGAVRIRTDKDLTLEGTNVSGEKGVGLTAGGDLKLLQAQDSSDTRSATQSGDARVSVAVSLVGTSGSVGVGAHGREEESRDRQTTGIAGNIKSGSGNVDLVAGRDMTLQGTNIGAKGDVGLDAKGKIDYQAAVSTREKTGRIDGGGGSVDVSYGASGGNKSMGANVSADFDRGRTDYRERTETGGRVNAGGTFTLKSGGDARLQGSEVKAATADVTVGGNLTIESARRTVKEDSSRVSGIVNVGGSKGGGAQMANTGGQAGSSGNSFGADAQVKVDISKQDIERNSNASITTSGRTTLNVSNATLAGANVEAGAESKPISVAISRWRAALIGSGWTRPR
ncbi:MAG: hemagglutinin repeat-containing protein [Zoogloea sp.]|nr:hemagglutinin repeat-containing protein [Zoogloea sp.]